MQCRIKNDAQIVRGSQILLAIQSVTSLGAVVISWDNQLHHGSLCNHLMGEPELHGGAYKLEKQMSRGTDFTLLLEYIAQNLAGDDVDIPLSGVGGVPIGDRCNGI